MGQEACRREEEERAERNRLRERRKLRNAPLPRQFLNYEGEHEEPPPQQDWHRHQALRD